MKSKNSHFSYSFLKIKFNRKYLFYLSFINLVGWLILVHKYDLFRKLRADDPYKPPLDQATIRVNIFFLKTHKTGSSTIQNIFMRFGLHHSLNFLLPRAGNYLGYSRPISDTDIEEDLTPPDRKFNIFALHSRYHENVNLYLYNNTIRVTILRYPPHQFESNFHFYGWDNRINISLKQLLTQMSLGKQLNFSSQDQFKTPLYNRMSYDLGLKSIDVKNKNDIQDFINYIDQQFDYVMIMEYMEASLVMLADLMGWPLDYVATLPLMKRAEFKKYNLTPADELKLSALNRADTMLYDHYLEKFRKCILRYGLIELVKSIEKLKHINKALVNRCVNSTGRGSYGGTINYRVNDPFDLECKYVAESELHFIDELRQEQKDRLKTIKNIYKLVNASP